MIEVYTALTPNGRKVHIMLEEVGLPYELHPVDIWRGEQFRPEFLAISPNNKIPAIVDQDGPGGQPFHLAESGAILWYLAEKAGALLPSEPRARHRVHEWLMFQMAHIGPLLGQAHHFRDYATERIPYAIDRYTNEAARLYSVLDRRLADHEFLGGAYSIADIATYPWIRPHRLQGQDLADFPNVERWFRAVEARPAVQRGLQLLRGARRPDTLTEEARTNLFGPKQYERR